MSRIFIGEKEQKTKDFNELIENIGKNQKEIIEKLKTKFNIFDSEKRKHKLNMLSIIWVTYLSTIEKLEEKKFTKEDFNLIFSLTPNVQNSQMNNFISMINGIQAPNLINNSMELFGANLIKMEKKKSDLKTNLNNKEREDEKKVFNTCIFCIEQFNENDLMNPLLMECNKHVHGKCFIDYIEEELNNNRFPIKCPLCAGNERHEINYKTIIDCLLLNNKDNLAAKLENISLNHLAENNPEEITFCPTAGCNYMCSYDKKEFHLECPLCKKSYCLQCKAEWHKNMTCEEYQKSINKNENDAQFELYIKGNKLKQCPKCKRWVEKIDGCDHIICSCGTPFCYKCGRIKERDDGHFCRFCNHNGIFFNYPLFGFNNNMGNDLYNNNQGPGLFGNINNNNQGQGLFGNNNDNQNQNNNNIFNSRIQDNNSFGNNKIEETLIFDDNSNNNIHTGGLFNNFNNEGNNIFANNNNNINQNNTLFSNNNQGNYLFGNNNNNNQYSIFGTNNNSNNNTNQNSLFGNINNNQ